MNLKLKDYIDNLNLEYHLENCQCRYCRLSTTLPDNIYFELKEKKRRQENESIYMCIWN